MPSTKRVGDEPKRIACEILEHQGGEATSRQIRQALQDEDYKYPPSVVMNELIEEGVAERDEERGVYRLKNTSGQQFERGGDRGDRGNRQGRQDRSNGNNRQSGGNRGQQMQSIDEFINRLREVNQEERKLIDQLSEKMEQVNQIAMAFMGQGGQGQRRSQDQEDDRNRNRGNGGGRGNGNNREEEDED